MKGMGGRKPCVKQRKWPAVKLADIHLRPRVESLPPCLIVILLQLWMCDNAIHGVEWRLSFTLNSLGSGFFIYRRNSCTTKVALFAYLLCAMMAQKYKNVVRLTLVGLRVEVSYYSINSKSLKQVS